MAYWMPATAGSYERSGTQRLALSKKPRFQKKITTTDNIITWGESVVKEFFWASSKNTEFSNTMVQKFQIVKISGILRHHVSHGTRFRTNLAHFRVILAPFRLMGTQFFRGLPKGGEAVRLYVRFFRLSLTSARRRPFVKIFRLSCASLLISPNTCSTRLRTHDLR